MSTFHHSTTVATVQLNQFNNATPPSSTQSFANTFTLKLSRPTTLRNAEVALVSMSCYYSWFNIKSTYGNNNISYQLSGQSVVNLTLPDGIYTINDINNYMQLDMYNRGYYMLDQNNQPFYFLSIAANPTYYCITLSSIPVSSATMTANTLTNPNSLTLTGYAPQLILPITPTISAAGSTQPGVSSMGRVLGFATSTTNTTAYPSSNITTTNYQYNGTSTPQITMTDSVNVLCSLVSNNIISSAASSLIYSFAPTVTSGQQIFSNPTNLVYYPVMDGIYTDITIRLVDNSFTPLQIQDPSVNIVIAIRQASS